MISPSSNTRLNLADDFLFYLVCGYVLLVPLAFWSLVYRAFSLPKALTAFSLAVLISAVMALRPAKDAVGGPAFNRLIFVFCLGLLPSAIFSISPASWFLGSYRQLGGVAAYMALAALAYGTAAVKWDDERLRDLTAAVAIGAGIVSLIAWAQAFHPDVNLLYNFESLRRPVFSTFGNAGYLAVYIAFALPIVFVKMVDARAASGLMFYGAVQVSAAGALAFSGSRTGWLAAAAALIFAIALARSELGRSAPAGRRKRLWAAGCLPFLAFGIALMSPLATVDQVTGPAISRLSSGTGTLEARSAYWAGALRMTASRPMTGFGPDTFGLIYPKLAAKTVQKLEPDVVTDNAHNLFLQMTATFGVVPLLAFGALLVISVQAFRAFLSGSSGGEGPKNKLLVSGFAAGVFGHLLAVQGTIDSWGTSFIPWVFFGLAQSLRTNRKPRNASLAEAPRRLAFLLPLLFFAVFSAALYKTGVIYGADRIFAAAQFAPDDNAKNMIRTATRLSRKNETYWLTLAAKEAAANPKAAEAAAFRARAVSPLSYLPPQFLAQLYLADGAKLPGSRRRARDAVEEALELFPNSPRLLELKKAAYSQRPGPGR